MESQIYLEKYDVMLDITEYEEQFVTTSLCLAGIFNVEHEDFIHILQNEILSNTSFDNITNNFYYLIDELKEDTYLESYCITRQGVSLIFDYYHQVSMLDKQMLLNIEKEFIKTFMDYELKKQYFINKQMCYDYNKLSLKVSNTSIDKNVEIEKIKENQRKLEKEIDVYREKEYTFTKITSEIYRSLLAIKEKIDEQKQVDFMKEIRVMLGKLEPEFAKID